jgi:hypothetical protein
MSLWNKGLKVVSLVYVEVSAVFDTAEASLMDIM